MTIRGNGEERIRGMMSSGRKEIAAIRVVKGALFLEQAGRSNGQGSRVKEQSGEGGQIEFGLQVGCKYASALYPVSFRFA